MTKFRPALVAGLCASLACTVHAASLNEFIAVSSTTAPDYVRTTDAQGRMRPASYIFTQGLFLESGLVDRGLQKSRFTDIVQNLAPGLAKQNYFPTRNVPAADLVIVVHWGSTFVDDNAERDRMIESVTGELNTLQTSVQLEGYGETGPLDNISEFFSMTRENSNYALARNAALLGYSRELIKDHSDFGKMTASESAIRNELSEERYFVVLMAYDYQALKKEKKSKLLWVTRLSVRAPGNNFAEALPVFTQAGSHVFGRQVSGLAHLDANLREGVVSIQGLRSLGIADDASLEKQPQ